MILKESGVFELNSYDSYESVGLEIFLSLFYRLLRAPAWYYQNMNRDMPIDLIKYVFMYIHRKFPIYNASRHRKTN